MADTEQPDEVMHVTAEQLGLQLGEEHDGQLEFDVGNLTVWDPSPIDTVAFSGPSKEEAHMEASRAMTQSLINKLFALPSEAIKNGRQAQLPEPTTRLPRQKPLPKPKPLTKWQQFALKKGIQKKTRTKLLFDETSQEFKRRYGYQKADDPNAVPIIDAKPGDKLGEDPFTAMDETKKKNVVKNKKQQLHNAKMAAKAGALPSTLKLAAVLGSGGPSTTSKAGGQHATPRTKRKDLKEEIKMASRLSGVSTASLGKFDQKLKGEKPGERAPLGKRRKFLPVTDTNADHSRFTSMADRFLRERSEDVIDVRKAIVKHEAGAREERKAAKDQLYQKMSKRQFKKEGGGKPDKEAKAPGLGKVARGRVGKPAKA
eukprot:CAMPEP_0119109276 /NCGR_PEP_ID=MMETSP1180-20130426/17822_1 /TAXON_ID=3052 ORGANISM="Chlamydomonas cf sp, Strain CCMP681" /NCGR_SAMPLE_ID=MMETSP1180 /ASSEMBLY_ACC=CAM_ASM_000741 /LENGTH=370 /DNA_ID=CAMNT_0007095017 /DNA_START=97 /DNA_END=1205 /DNA_ORIENTATION=-